MKDIIVKTLIVSALAIALAGCILPGEDCGDCGYNAKAAASK